MNTNVYGAPQPYLFFDPNMGNSFQGQQYQLYDSPFAHFRQSRPEDLQLIDSLKQEIQKLTFLLEEKDAKIQELNQKLLSGQTSNYQETEIANLKKQLVEKDVFIGKMLSQTHQITNTSVSAPKIEDMSPVPQFNSFQQLSQQQQVVQSFFGQDFTNYTNQPVNQYQNFQ